MAQLTRTGDLTSGPLLKKIILFSLPLAASSILQLLFNAADVVVVGRFAGSTALAAVGSNGALINLLVNLFVGLSLGANVVAARCFGAKDERGVQNTVQTSVTLGLVSGVLLAFVGFFAARGLLELMSCPEDVIDLSTLYLKIYFIGMPMTMLYNFNASLLRAVGDTRRPLYCLAVSGVINVVLNLVFVILFQMSVAGVALATIISQTVSALMVTVLLMKEESPLHLDLRHLGFHKGALVQILKIGLPAGLQSTVFSLSNVVIQSAVNSFGSTIVAGNSAAANIEGFIYTGMNAFAQAAVTFTSQNVGARRYDNLDRVMRNCLLCMTRSRLSYRRRRSGPDEGHLHQLLPLRHHGHAGQLPARPGLLRPAHDRQSGGQLPAPSGVDRHHLPAVPLHDHAVHQLPHQLAPDRFRPSRLPAGGAAASAPEAAADGIEPFCIKAMPGRPKGLSGIAFTLSQGHIQCHHQGKAQHDADDTGHFIRFHRLRDHLLCGHTHHTARRRAHKPRQRCAYPLGQHKGQHRAQGLHQPRGRPGGKGLPPGAPALGQRQTDRRPLRDVLQADAQAQRQRPAYGIRVPVQRQCRSQPHHHAFRQVMQGDRQHHAPAMPGAARQQLPGGILQP